MKFRVGGTIEGDTIIEAANKGDAVIAFEAKYPFDAYWNVDLDVEPILPVNTRCFVICLEFGNYERPEFHIFTDEELANDCYSDHLDGGEQKSLIFFEGRIIKRKDQ